MVGPSSRPVLHFRLSQTVFRGTTLSTESTGMLRAAEMAEKTDRAALRRVMVSTSLALALLCGACLRIYWTFLIPYNDAPDEFCHLPMVRYLARHGRPPTMANVPREIPVSYPAMCPLGYVPLAIPVALAGANDGSDLRVARLANAAIGVALIFLVYSALRQLAPSWPEAAGAGAWIAALHPQLVFISAYVNNDATMLLVVAGLWIAWIRLARAGSSLNGAEGRKDGRAEEERTEFVSQQSRRLPALYEWSVAGVLSGLAILTKPNAAGVALAGLPILIMQCRAAWRARKIGAFLVAPAMGVAAGLLVLTPWCLWNWRSHHSLLGLDIHRDWWQAHTSEAGVRQGYLTSDSAGAFLSGTWNSFWGCFGYASTRLPELDYQIVTLVCGVAIGAFLCRFRELCSSGSRTKRENLLAVCCAFVVGSLAVWLSHAWHSAHHGMAAQGRYVLPTALPCLCLLAIGTLLIARRGREWIPAGFLVTVFAWLQFSSIAAEQQSNRLSQPDRRVRARLLALVSDVPGTRLATEPMELVGAGELAVDGHAATIHSAGEARIRLPNAIPADALGGVEIEQRWLGGIPATGELVLRDADTQAPLATIPYRDALLGAASYRFDLRKITDGLDGHEVTIDIAPSSEPCHVEWYRLSILDRNLGPISIDQ